MATSVKKILLALGAAGLLAGCATGYYDDYGYYGDRYSYDAYGPTYYDYYPGYVGPSVGFGFGYSDRSDYRRHWHRDRDRDWRSRDGWDTFRDGRRRDSGG